MRIGFVGVGAMGRAMALHVQRAGFAVVGMDIDAAAREASTAAGLPVCDTLEALAGQVDHVIVVVVTDAQSRSVTEGLLAAGLPQGAIIAIAATNHPDTMIELQKACGAKGVGFIDAPVVFGLKGAVDGDLGTLCGGEVAHVEALRPVMAAYSRFVEHVGGVGAGQLAKTCNNMLHWVLCVANYEVLLLATRFGIPAPRMREILLQCPARNVTLERWDSTNMTWHEKDMDVAMDLGQAGEVPLPLFGQVDQLVKLLNRDRLQTMLRGDVPEYLGRRIEPLARDAGGLA